MRQKNVKINCNSQILAAELIFILCKYCRGIKEEERKSVLSLFFLPFTNMLDCMSAAAVAAVAAALVVLLLLLLLLLLLPLYL